LATGDGIAWDRPAVHLPKADDLLSDLPAGAIA
jgi:hypothetical protein